MVSDGPFVALPLSILLHATTRRRGFGARLPEIRSTQIRIGGHISEIKRQFKRNIYWFMKIIRKGLQRNCCTLCVAGTTMEVCRRDAESPHGDVPNSHQTLQT